jgi:hypothetical protein
VFGKVKKSWYDACGTVYFKVTHFSHVLVVALGRLISEYFVSVTCHKSAFRVCGGVK